MNKLLTAFILILTMSCAHADFRGVHISDKTHIDEIEEFANAFSYAPSSASDLQDLLSYNDGRLIPFIELARYFFDEELGIYKWRQIEPIRDAVGSNHIIIMLDEPFWHVRLACQEGKQLACDEVMSGFAGTNAVFTRLKYDLGYQVLHVEAYAELALENPVKMLQAADHVAFDCYGEFDTCGGYGMLHYGELVYDSIQGTGKKMMLIPGAFMFDGVLDQLDRYFDFYVKNKELFSGIGAFTWGGYDGITGARDLPEIKQKLIKLINEKE